MTMCVEPERVKKDCPITDIMLVDKNEYLVDKYEGYSIADGAEELSWYLLYSQNTAYLPLTNFNLTEEQPCTLDDTLQVKSDVSKENFYERTRDNYRESCPQHYDKFLSTSYRSASNKITINEETWLDNIGAKEII